MENNVFDSIKIGLASPEQIRAWSYGEVKKPETRVPDAGYRIIGLPVAGFDRKHLWKNFSVL